MKKVLLFISLFTFGSSFAQDCSKIFISEYVEGWSNNKALEIYNPTNQAVDLSQYFVTRYSNGSPDGTLLNSIQLTGTIQPYGVYVAVLDKRVAGGQGQEAPIWDSLVVKANGFYCPDYTANKTFYWNGNDAVVLFKGTLPTGQPNSYNINQIAGIQPIDRVGKVGEDPAAGSTGSGTTPAQGWTTQAPYNNGAGIVVTADHSLIRKSTIKKGDIAATGSFNALAEWDTIPAVTILLDQAGDTIKSNAGAPIKFGNWNSLGSHDCGCNPADLAVSKVSTVQMELYPNPSANGAFTVSASENIKAITVYNTLGQVMKKTKPNMNNASLQIGNSPGLYIVQIETAEGTATKRLIIKN